MSLVNEVVMSKMAGATERMVRKKSTSSRVATFDGSSVFSRPILRVGRVTGCASLGKKRRKRNVKKMTKLKSAGFRPWALLWPL